MKSPRIREAISLIAFALAFLLSIPLVAGFFGSAHPALDALGHLRAHIATLMIFFALASLAGSMWRQGLMAIVLGLAAITTTLGFHNERTALQPVDGAAVFRLLQMNLRYDNAEPEKVLSMIGRVRPDVIALDEVSDMWVGKLDLLASAYPYRIICMVGNRAGGVAILSLRPFVESAKPKCDDGGVFALAMVDFGGREVEIGALHLHRPWPSTQHWQVEELKPLLGAIADTAILAGDMNSVPWSYTVAKVIEAGGFTVAPRIGPTWIYRRLPDLLRFAGFPVDQIFAKGDVVAHSARTLPAAGSDHLPVLFEFSLKPASKSEDAPSAVTESEMTGRKRT